MQPADAAEAIPIHLVTESGWPALAGSLPTAAKAFAEACGFEPKAGQHCLLPGDDGRLAAVLFGVDEPGKPGADPLLVGKLPGLLPKGNYRLAGNPADPELAALAWLLGSYRFERYRAKPKTFPQLVAPEGIAAEEVERIAAAVAMGRDLVNTPANDLGPDGIEAAARALAERHKAAITVTVGDDLLAANLPMIHAVGRAAGRAPRLIDMRWGDESHPKITLVGKGVAFDTGGLDIKPSAGMLLMKKDMGGRLPPSPAPP